MTHDRDPNNLVMERVERRLSEECGMLRVEMAQMRGELRTEIAQTRGELKADMVSLRGEMRADMSDLRAEMVRGNTALLKWLLVFFVSQTAALAAIVRLFVN